MLIWLLGATCSCKSVCRWFRFTFWIISTVLFRISSNCCIAFVPEFKIKCLCLLKSFKLYRITWKWMLIHLTHIRIINRAYVWTIKLTRNHISRRSDIRSLVLSIWFNLSIHWISREYFLRRCIKILLNEHLFLILIIQSNIIKIRTLNYLVDRAALIHFIKQWCLLVMKLLLLLINFLLWCVYYEIIYFLRKFAYCYCKILTEMDTINSFFFKSK